MPLAYGLTEPADLALTHLPQPLDGLRIGHVTDLHLRKRSPTLDRLIGQLAKMRLDLGLLTGDYMTRGGPYGPALDYLKALTHTVRPAMGWFGVTGNHDTPGFIERLYDLPVTWLSDAAVGLAGSPIEIVGLRCTANERRPDALCLARAVAALPTGPAERAQRLRLVLSHSPDFMALASDLGGDLMVSGHTHGGQVRLPMNIPLVNSCDLPLHLSAGLMRHRQSLGVISRGLGNTGLCDAPLRLRLLCPRHAPVYTLRRRTTPGDATDDLQSIWRW